MKSWKVARNWIAFYWNSFVLSPSLMRGNWRPSKLGLFAKSYRFYLQAAVKGSSLLDCPKFPKMYFFEGAKIRAGRWRFLVRFLFHLVKILPKFTTTSGSLRQNIFDNLYRNTKTNSHHAVSSHCTLADVFWKMHILLYAQDGYASCLDSTQEGFKLAPPIENKKILKGLLN